MLFVIRLLNDHITRVICSSTKYFFLRKKGINLQYGLCSKKTSNSDLFTTWEINKSPINSLNIVSSLESSSTLRCNKTFSRPLLTMNMFTLAGLLMNAAWLQIMGRVWKQYSILVPKHIFENMLCHYTSFSLRQDNTGKKNGVLQALVNFEILYYP